MWKNASEAGKLGWIKSRKTMELKYKKLQDDYYSNPKKCLNCGVIIPYKKRENNFCCYKCAGLYNNNKYRDKYIRSKTISCKVLMDNNGITKLVINCLNCGKEINRNSPKHKFCDSKCQQEYYFKQNIQLIEEKGEFPSRYQGECSRPFVKKYLIYKNGHKCSICNNTEWMGKPIPLVVDHIDGNPLNNKINNFRLVCGNCDMQLPTYKCKNRGKGRTYRRKNIITE